MADNPVVQQLVEIGRQLANQDAGSYIKTFSGAAKDYKDWIKGIEKHALLNNSEPKRSAFRTSGGPVADFIHRSLVNNPNQTWQEMKAELAVRFAETVDPVHAMSQLRRCKQQKGETVQLYGERMLDLATEAFPGQDLANPIIQRQMIEIFTDGIFSNGIARKILRDNPQTFQEAVNSSTQEQTLYRKYAARQRVEVPMEVNEVRGIKCYHCQKEGHVKMRCPDLKEQMEQRLCWQCGQPGHIRRNCRQAGGNNYGPKN